MSANIDVVESNLYKRNLKKMVKRGKDIGKLQKTINLIKQHRLKELKDLHPITKGRYAGNMDCHIEGDWVLIWRYEDDKLILVLVDTGDHQMLFGENFSYDDDISSMSAYWKHIVLR